MRLKAELALGPQAQGIEFAAQPGFGVRVDIAVKADPAVDVGLGRLGHRAEAAHGVDTQDADPRPGPGRPDLGEELAGQLQGRQGRGVAPDLARRHSLKGEPRLEHVGFKQVGQHAQVGLLVAVESAQGAHQPFAVEPLDALLATHEGQLPRPRAHDPGDGLGRDARFVGAGGGCRGLRRQIVGGCRKLFKAVGQEKGMGRIGVVQAAAGHGGARHGHGVQGDVGEPCGVNDAVRELDPIECAGGQLGAGQVRVLETA